MRGACVCARACVRARVRACACVRALQIYVDDYMTSFYSPWATYIELISAPPQQMEECTHKHVNGDATRPPGCESNFAIDVSNANSTLADLQAQVCVCRVFSSPSHFSCKLISLYGSVRSLEALLHRQAAKGDGPG